MITFTFAFAEFPSLLAKTRAPMYKFLHSSGLDSASNIIIILIIIKIAYSIIGHSPIHNGRSSTNRPIAFNNSSLSSSKLSWCMNAPPLSKVMLARSLETISKQCYRPAIRSIFTSIFIPFRKKAIVVTFLSNNYQEKRREENLRMPRDG